MFRVNLYRRPFSEIADDSGIGEASEKHRRNMGEDFNETQRKILELLSVDAKLSAAKLAQQVGVSGRNVEVNIKKLKERGILIRCGSPKSGYWKITEKKSLD